MRNHFVLVIYAVFQQIQQDTSICTLLYKSIKAAIVAQQNEGIMHALQITLVINVPMVPYSFLGCFTMPIQLSNKIKPYSI